MGHMAVPLSYDGLYTLRITPSLVQTNTLLLTASDALGNLIDRPTIDEEDAAPVYSVELQGASSSSATASPSPSPSGQALAAAGGSSAPSVEASSTAISSLHLLDPLSDAKLATAFSVTPNKLRHVQLHNPPLLAVLKNKSLLSFEWAFHYEDSRFAWGRSRDTVSLSTRDTGYTCKMARKPDPDVTVAVYKPAKKGNLLQILDYNLNRFTFEDRKATPVATPVATPTDGRIQLSRRPYTGAGC